MTGAVFAALALAQAAAAAPPPFCEVPADCGEGGVCLSGLCRVGSERSLVTPQYTLGVPDAVVTTNDGWLRAEADRLVAQLRQDLAWTGLYGVLPPDRRPPGWSEEGASPSEVRRVAWQLAGAWRVLQVSARPDVEAGSYRARLRLVELERDRVIDLPGGDVLVRAGGTRRAAATWVNQLVAYDTGLPGAVGTRLVAAVETRPGVKEIGVLDADGQALSLVTENGSLNLSPAWGPGGRIGYMSYRSGNADWVVDGEPVSTRPGLNAAGAWSPDGQWLAISLTDGGNSDLYVLYGDTGEEHVRLTDHPAVDTSPAWSPDGRRIAFVSDRTGSPQIYVATLDSPELQRVTQGGYTTSPDWSPNGQTLVYALQIGGGAFALMRHDLDTGRTVRISPQGGSAESPTFSPDGRYIAFVRKDPGRPAQLWVMDADGSRARPLATSHLALFSPDWQRW